MSSKTNYDKNANAIQDAEAVKSYKEKSNLQQEGFRKLLAIANIEKGWKILDMGCGTGNNTALLAEIVGKEGNVIGTDPIKERIEEASESFKGDNLEFFTDFGKNSFKYGQDFDVVFANFVMHWIPTEEKCLTFQGISDSLRFGGKFIFGDFLPSSLKMKPILGLFPDKFKEKYNADFFHETEEKFKKLALDAGFKSIFVEQKEYRVVFKNIDDWIQWFAASMHNFEHDEVVNVFKEICENEDVSFLYNEQGEVEHRFINCFYTCTK